LTENEKPHEHVFKIISAPEKDEYAARRMPVSFDAGKPLSLWQAGGFSFDTLNPGCGDYHHPYHGFSTRKAMITIHSFPGKCLHKDITFSVSVGMKLLLSLY
jgi:hypothetical protein